MIPTGTASLAWSGHLFHIALPIGTLQEAGVDPSAIPATQDLISCQVSKLI